MGEAGKPGHTTPDPGSSSRPRPMSMRYSPGILSPTSPVGSVSAGIILVHNFYPFLCFADIDSGSGSVVFSLEIVTLEKFLLNELNYKINQRDYSERFIPTKRLFSVLSIIASSLRIYSTFC